MEKWFLWPPKPVRVWRETPTFDRLAERFKKGEFACEPKIDGWRVLVYVNNGKVQAMSRHGKALVLKDEIVYGLCSIPNDTLLDGELLGFRAKPPIISSVASEVFRAMTDQTSGFFAFDVVKYNGVFVKNQPYRERRKILEGCMNVDYVLTLNNGELRDLYDLALKQGNEGLVLKKVNSPWKAMSGEGQEFDAWIKIKRRPKIDQSGKVQQ